MTGMTRTLCTRSRRISDRDHLGDDEQEKQSAADDDGDPDEDAWSLTGRGASW